MQGATLGSAAAAAGRARRPRPGPAAPAPARRRRADGAQGTIGGVPAYTVGNAVTVVTGEELRAQQVRHAAEALRSLPGVAVSRSGGFGNLTQVRIRGAEGNHTLVLIDGIEANNTADGEFDFSNLSAEDIERIEVIRGPMSGLYGSNAVGGVINIITRTRQGPADRDGAHRRRLVRHARRGRARVPAAATRRTSRRLLPLARHRRLQHRARSATSSDGSRLGTFTVRGGAKLLPGVTLDFTRAPHARRPPIATASAARARHAGDRHRRSLDAATTSVLLAGTNLRWDMLGGRLTQEFRANHNGTITADTDRSPFSSDSTQHQRDRQARLSRHLPLRHAGDLRPSIRSPAASRRRTSASRPRAPSPTGWSASAAASPTRASGAAASPTGCSSPPASAATTTTTSRTSRPGARPPRWCCARSACGRMPASARP